MHFRRRKIVDLRRLLNESLLSRWLIDALLHRRLIVVLHFGWKVSDSDWWLRYIVVSQCAYLCNCILLCESLICKIVAYRPPSQCVKEIVRVESWRSSWEEQVARPQLPRLGPVCLPIWL